MWKTIMEVNRLYKTSMIYMEIIDKHILYGLPTILYIYILFLKTKQTRIFIIFHISLEVT